MPKRTHQPKNRKRQREHGWRARLASKSGRAIVSARRLKGRSKLTA